MKRKRIAAAVLSIMLTMAGAAVCFGASGWQKSGSNWVYYDTNGRKVANEWQKGADGLWRYLDYNGNMALNSWVDGDYYVDANGIMVAGKCMKLAKKDDGWDNNAEQAWYYFTSDGKAASDSWQKISDKWYYFNGDGEMQTGWADDDLYYLGDDGTMRTGWQYLEDPDADDNDDDDVRPYEDDDDHHWYYFQSSGKRYVPETGGDSFKKYKIDGVNYYFDEEGRMQTGWICVSGDEDNFKDYRYLQDNGKLTTGWYSTYPPEDYEGDVEDEVQWYYFGNDGEPKVGPSVENASVKDLEKINGITYLFDENGNPVYGLRNLNNGSDFETYYFGDRQTSSVQKGKMTIEEGDGTKSEFYFTESGGKAGRGFTGVKNKYLFYKGKLQEADDGTKYEVICVEGRNYLVNPSGKVMEDTTVKDSSGTRFETNKTGVVVKVDKESDNGDEYARDPYEPVEWD